MAENASRIRINPHVFANLRSFVLNILRANHAQNMSLELFTNGMNINRIRDYNRVR